MCCRTMSVCSRMSLLDTALSTCLFLIFPVPIWSFFSPPSFPPQPWSDLSLQKAFRAGENLPSFSTFHLSKVDNKPSPFRLSSSISPSVSLQVKMPYGCGHGACWGAGWRRRGMGRPQGCILPVLFLLSPAVFPLLLPLN